METWTCRLLFAFLTLSVLIPFASGHEISVPSNAYFGIPAYGTYINFEHEMTLEEAYRENDFWCFDGFGFSVQFANLTISKFFADNQLVFTVTTAYEVASIVSVVLPESIGMPSSVVGASSWTYDPTINCLTVTVKDSKLATVMIDWASQPVGIDQGVKPPDLNVVTAFVVGMLVALAVTALVLVFLAFAAVQGA